MDKSNGAEGQRLQSANIPIRPAATVLLVFGVVFLAGNPQLFVEIDREQGKIEVLRITQAYECGAILNPLDLEAQVEGCIVMGLGGALTEAMQFEDGKILNATLKKYDVPRFEDVPEMDILLLDRPDLPSAGAGECPIIAVAPAIGNAVFRATGKRLRSLPLQAALSRHI